jgi:hypothetical protein
MQNPDRNFMSGLTCHLAQVDLDNDFDSWTSALSTYPAPAADQTLIDNANSRLTFFCAGTAPTSPPIRPPYPSFPAAPVPPAGWSQVLVYPNYACLDLAIATDPATLSNDAYYCDMGNPGRDVMNGLSCQLEQVDMDPDFDTWISALTSSATTDPQQQLIDNASSRLTYFCPQYDSGDSVFGPNSKRKKIK